MTRILSEPHLECRACLDWQWCHAMPEYGTGIGVCRGKESREHGHVLAGEHQACRHLRLPEGQAAYPCRHRIADGQMSGTLTRYRCSLANMPCPPSHRPHGCPRTDMR